MQKQRVSSPRPRSLLLERFIARSGKSPDERPEQIIEGLVSDQVRKRVRDRDKLIHLFLKDRNVLSIDDTGTLDCDGFIEPLGSSYEEGFRIRISAGSVPVRRRFTLAHEACHTFFYELVPELKFAPHIQDAEEEKLCNAGAAALLIPYQQLSRRVRTLPTNLDSLRLLASEYGVSMPTMVLRLRSLGLWRVELSIWHRMIDGSFVLDKLYGGSKTDWEWVEDGVLKAAWQRRESIFGTSFIRHQDARGVRRFRPVAFELRRHSDGLIGLWGKGLIQQTKPVARLF